MAAAAEALEGTAELPQIGSPDKKTTRIQFDADSAAAGKASDVDRMRSKRSGSIGVTKLNESKAKRAAAAHAQRSRSATSPAQTPARPAVPFERCLLR